MAAAKSANESPPETLPLEEQIRRRAFELYIERGCQPGRDHEDWVKAEQEILRARQDARIEASKESFPSSEAPAY